MNCSPDLVDSQVATIPVWTGNSKNSATRAGVRDLLTGRMFHLKLNAGDTQWHRIEVSIPIELVGKEGVDETSFGGPSGRTTAPPMTVEDETNIFDPRMLSATSLQRPLHPHRPTITFVNHVVTPPHRAGSGKHRTGAVASVQ